MAIKPVRDWTERLWRLFGDGDTSRGMYIPSRRALRIHPDNQSLFGEMLVAQRRTVISINSAFGVSNLRQNTTTTGSASVDTGTTGKIILKTGTTAGSLSRITTGEVGTYAPGFDAEIGIGIRVPQTFAGTAAARWGGLSASGQDGLYFKKTASQQIAAVRMKDNVEETVVPRSSWNLDKFDGTGQSGVNIDLDNGYIWQVDFTWYGYGLIVFGLVRNVPLDPGVQRFIPGHYIQIEGDISISEPNLEIFAEIDNGDQSTNYDLNVGGMQYAIVGRNDSARRRSVDDYVSAVTGVGTSLTHLISFRRKSGFLNRSFQLEQLKSTVSTERMIMEVWLGGDVTLATGEAYDTPTRYTPSETSIESVKQQTFDETNADLLYRTYVDAGQANKSGTPEAGLIDLNLPVDGLITLTARTLQNTGTVNVALLRGSEGW